MRRRIRVPRRFIAVWSLVVVMALAGSAGASPPDGARLAAASPGPGSVVGGTIDEFELLFADLITSVDGSVVAADGAELDAVFELDSEIRVTVALAAPLSEPGVYTVRHVVTTPDDDVLEGSYDFTFEPSAAPPQLVFLDVPEDEEGTNWIVWVVVVIGAVVIGVLAWRLWSSIRRQRQLARSTQ